MQEIEELRQRMLSERPVEWTDFPDIGLYMDQIISYMPRQLINYKGDNGLTSAMVNNYIKEGMLPRAEGKRYCRTHLAYLTAICALKQVLSVRDVSQLMALNADPQEVQVFYDLFRQDLDRALTETADSLDAGLTEGSLARAALGLALRSYADKLACERLLDVLRQREGPKKEGKEKSKK